MPYKSEAQRKFFNSPAGKEKLGEEEVEKWNEESKGQKNLPEKVSSKDTWNEAIRNCDAASITYNEIKSVYNLVSDAMMYRSDEKKVFELLRKAQSELLTLAVKAK